MKSKTILTTSGTLLLAVVAVFAGKAKPFSTITTVYYAKNGACCSLTVSASSMSIFTTGSATGIQATIRTQSAGTRRTLWGACSGGTVTHPAYFHSCM
jgi:hypothetical protein